MARYVAVLEDNGGRISAMQACLRELLPDCQSTYFDDASKMITWLREHLGEVVLMSLDHDLSLRDVQGRRIDCGTGREVAEYLAALQPTCPIILHSSNVTAAYGMLFLLREAGWPTARVYPWDDIAWVRQSWAEQVRHYLRDGWLARE